MVKTEENELDRPSTDADIIRFVKNNQPCRHADIIRYLTSDIIREGILTIARETAKSRIKKLYESGELLKNGSGKYVVTITAPASPYHILESMEMLASPFVESITLYVMETISPDSLRRFQEYISMKIKLQYDVRVLRFHEAISLSEEKIGNNYSYAAFVFQKDLIKQVYLNTSKTNDYSGSGVHWYRKVEDFLSENKIDIITEDAGLETQPEQLKNLLIRWIVERGML